MYRRAIAFLLLLSSILPLLAQKRAMTVGDIPSWRMVGDIGITDDGNWINYSYRRLYTQNPDTVYLYEVKTGRLQTMTQDAFYKWRAEEWQRTHPQSQNQGGTQGDKSQTSPHFDFSQVKGLPADYKLSEQGSRIVNAGGLIILAREQDWNQPSPKAEEDSLHLELWKWDEPLSPRRRDRLYPKVSENTYLYDVKSRQLVMVPTVGMTEVYFPDGGQVYGGIAVDRHPYDKETDWILEAKQDVYYFGTDGSMKKVVSHQCAYPEFSPDGRYAVVYTPDSQSWISIDMRDGTVTDITKGKIPYPLYDEESDYPFAPKPYGHGNWDKDNRRVVIRDRYDFWSVSLDGKGDAECLTKGYGRKHKVRLRYNDKGFSTPDVTYLDGFNEHSKTRGFYALQRGRVRKLVADDRYNYRLECATKDLSRVVWSRENFSEMKYLLSDREFRNPRLLTDVNEPVKNIRRGTSRVYSWRLPDGTLNEGVLYLPDDFQKGKPRPMLVNYYERETEGTHAYKVPEYVSAFFDIPYCVSNGYVVFQPDITCKVGMPGESAMETVVSGVKQLVRDGIADERRIGINGHSWGGYITNFLVTHTDMFACASPCSAVSDDISDYLMLRGTGQPNMYFEEDSQGRLGKTLWEDRDMYIRESPIFEADKVNTPLLIVHGEQDSSVRADQGFNMFFAMRRLNKPAWMLNYRREGHQYASTAVCKDLTVRMMQFFDHYLKGAPAPDWMK
ncbi:S9 family peptidase [Prevotella sp. KH2C16]|uniref:alpha/beta hydrolase family protein n=1 Tax=Prevotella sp. KH2C16 TaxID=1855325 RepID=UPI0008E6595D|nr:prolyl oligopeptidase family serine peptidase [Prevotella sp. KH2C16]SFG26892.1 Dipeptidyl aminopeptidase/acylaminoacyl peptidase [Prevotella sp. KH2C16]